MVNEVMAKAITGIDDELITDAYNATANKHSRKPLFTIVSAAACLVLVFTALFLSAPKSPSVYLDDEKISNSPVLVSSPLSTASVTPRLSSELTICLTLDLGKTETRIYTSDGEFSLCGINQDTLFFEGSDYTADSKTARKELSLYWTVENPSEEITYTLTFEGKETQVLTLSFDEDAQNWSVFIEK